MTESGDPTSPAPYGTPPAAPPPYGAPPAYRGGDQQYGTPYYGAPAGPLAGTVAPMGLRLVARIIDGILTGVATIALSYAFGIKIFSSNSIYGGKYFAMLLIAAVVTAAYEVVLIAQRGATIGKAAAGIKVVRGTEAAVPGYPASLRRWILPTAANFVFSLITLLIYISPFFDNTGRRQGWHDKFANTFVVRR